MDSPGAGLPDLRPPDLVARFRGLPAVVRDAALVALLVAAGLAQQFGKPGVQHESSAHLVAHVAVIVAALLPLLMRRRFPFPALVVIAVVLGVSGSVGPLFYLDPSPAAFFGLVYATFHAVASCRRPVGWVALGSALLAVTLVLRPWVTPVAAWLPSYPLVLVAFVAGRAEQERRALAVALGERIHYVQAQRERALALALTRARAGLARDLHEVVVFALQRMRRGAEDALRRLSPPVRDPEPALAATEAAGRAALAEMRRLLELLRNRDQPLDVGHLEEPPEVSTMPGRSPSRSLPGPVSSWVTRLRRVSRKGWPVDVLLVAALSTAALLELRFWEGLLGASTPPQTFSREAQVWAVAWIALLLLRRKVPVATALAMVVMAFLQTYPFRYWSPVACLTALQIAVYTVAAHRTRGALPAVPWLVAVLAAVGVVSIPPPPLTVSVIGFLVIVAVTFMAAAYVGTVAGERRRLLSELDDQLVALEEARRTQLALALHEERAALAREMHDLVAHSVTLMVVQAGAARTVAAIDPVAASRAVAIALDAGHRATEELEQLLGLIRGGAGEPAQAPATRAVEDLVLEARRSGLLVDLERVGSHPPQPGGTIELFSYRIVQEALTNARKHAPGARVRVRLREEPDAIVVTVENDATTRPAPEVAALGTSQGLVGMRERVGLLGGHFTAGPCDDGGFAVEAVIPRQLVPA